MYFAGKLVYLIVLPSNQLAIKYLELLAFRSKEIFHAKQLSTSISASKIKGKATPKDLICDI